MVFKKTATRSKTSKKIFALGRKESMVNEPPAAGGYIVWELRANYNGQARGGLVQTWRYVRDGLAYEEAVELMNRRCGFEAFTLGAR